MQLQKYSDTDIISIGKAFAESGMFPDVKTAAQAIVKIQAGREIGIPPFASMNGIHIIQGKLTLGAGLMASTVKGSGKYDYKVTELTDTVCSIDFYQDGEITGASTFTIEDAKKAGTKNLDRFPKNMLFARAMSNGVKWFCADVFAGPVYTPEEFDVHIKEDKTEDTTAEVVEKPAIAKTTANKLDSLKETVTRMTASAAPRKAFDSFTNPTFEMAAEEMNHAKDLDDVRRVWKKYKLFQHDVEFATLKNEMKAKYEALLAQS
jgi:hypothetical protein